MDTSSRRKQVSFGVSIHFDVRVSPNCLRVSERKFGRVSPENRSWYVSPYPGAWRSRLVILDKLSSEKPGVVGVTRVYTSGCDNVSLNNVAPSAGILSLPLINSKQSERYVFAVCFVPFNFVGTNVTVFTRTWLQNRLCLNVSRNTFKAPCEVIRTSWYNNGWTACCQDLQTRPAERSVGTQSLSLKHVLP